MKIVQLECASVQMVQHTMAGCSGTRISASSKEEQKQSMDMRGKFACISAFGNEKDRKKKPHKNYAHKSE